MKAYVPSYQLRTPKDLTEALSILTNEPNWTPLAGGTDLMVLFESGKLSEGNYLNLWDLKELRFIDESADHIELGALTTYSDVRNHPTMQKEFPILVEAARLTGAVAIQNRGTLGGNIMNASPAADSPPAFLAYEAQLQLTSASASRWIEYKDFHQGYKKMDCAPSELLTRIRLPRSSAKAIQFYRKVGTRKAQAISKVCLAAMAQCSNRTIKKVRIAFGSVAPIPLRCFQLENWLQGKKLDDTLIQQAREKLASEISPIDDIRSTKSYRLRVSQNLVQQFLEML